MVQGVPLVLLNYITKVNWSWDRVVKSRVRQGTALFPWPFVNNRNLIVVLWLKYLDIVFIQDKLHFFLKKKTELAKGFFWNELYHEDKAHLLFFGWFITSVASDLMPHYSKTCLKRPLKKKTKIGFRDRLSLNAGQNYWRMLQWEHIRRLIWAFAGRTYHIVGNLMHWLKFNISKRSNDVIWASRIFSSN